MLFSKKSADKHEEHLMLLKRVYNHKSGTPVLSHVAVVRSKDRQNFSTKFVEDHLASGLITIAGDSLILNTVPAIEYRIIRRPGYYCCFDDCAMPDGSAAKTYISEKYAGKTSPDNNNPAGYRRDNFYACEKVG